MRSVLFVLFAFTSVMGLKAQDADYGGDDGAYGYTSVSYDASSNSISIYAETDIGSDGAYYNGVYLDTTFSDATSGQLLAHSNEYNSDCSEDNTPGETTNYFACSFPAIFGDTYSGVSEHGLTMLVTDPVEGEPGEYYDTDGYSTFASQNLSSPFAEIYTPPYVEYQTKLVNVPLGKTNDSETAGTPTTCGDGRDALIAEYQTDRAVYHPICSDFESQPSWDAGGWPYTFAQLTPGQTTAGGLFAPLQLYAVQLLNQVGQEIGFHPTVNFHGGYRNPNIEVQQATYYTDSRHMAGDAYDISTNGGGRPTYVQERDAGIDQQGCVEPDSMQGSDTYTHIDWRNLTDPQGTFRHSPCNSQWFTKY